MSYIDANGQTKYVNPGGLYTTDSDGYSNKSAIDDPYMGTTIYFKKCKIGSNFKRDWTRIAVDGLTFDNNTCYNTVANNSIDNWSHSSPYPVLNNYSEFSTINTSSVITNSMLSFLYTWPLSILGGTSSSPIVITIGEDLVLSDLDNYLNIKSNYITIDGNDKNINISDITNYKGFINNGTSINSGYENITINNIKVLSSISSIENNGGWICQSYFGNNTSQNNNILIKKCFSNGNISGSNSGGICGSNCTGSISGCFSSGNISGSNSGGICGSNCVGSISGCYSKGNINNNSSGISGYNYSGIVSNCYSLGINSGNGISFSSSSIIVSNNYIANGNWNYVEADNNLLISSNVWIYDMNGYYKIKDFVKNINKIISSVEVNYINIPNNYIIMKNIDNQNGIFYNSSENKLDFSNVTNQNMDNFITFDDKSYPTPNYKKYIINNSNKFQNLYFIKSDYEMINYIVTKVFINGATKEQIIHLSQDNINTYNWPLVLSKNSTLEIDSNIILTHTIHYFNIIGNGVTINGNNKIITKNILDTSNYPGLIYNSIYKNPNINNLIIL